MPSLTPEGREAQRGYSRKWYSENRERQKAWVVARKRKIQTWLDDRRASLACQRCGESDAACLDFHHKDESQKEISLGKAVTQGWAIPRIEAEITKCEVLCANCHRKHHAALRGRSSTERAPDF